MKLQSYKTILNSHGCHFKLIGINKAGPMEKNGQPNTVSDFLKLLTILIFPAQSLRLPH